MGKGIIVGGCALVDVIKTINAYPHEGELADIGDIRYSTGGALCNVLLGLNRLSPDIRLTAAGVLGEDALGERVLDALRRGANENVDLSHIKRRGRGSFTDVYQSALTRQRTFFHERGANRLLDIEDFPLEGSDAGIMYVGYALLLDSLDASDAECGTRMARLLKKAQELHMRTCIDMVSEQSGRMRDIVPHALKHADICLCNEVEAAAVTGVGLRAGSGELDIDGVHAALHALREAGARGWAIIHAPEAAFGIDERGEVRCQPSAKLPPSAIAGTVGAGDAFCSGVLVIAHQNGTLASALEAGAAAACRSLTAAGATEGMTTLDISLDEFRGLDKVGVSVRR